MAELSRARRSTMGKRIWLSMHPRNFGPAKSSLRTFVNQSIDQLNLYFNTVKIHQVCTI